MTYFAFSLHKLQFKDQLATMGLHFSRIWERMFGKKEMRILMVGLDAAGKVSVRKRGNGLHRALGNLHTVAASLGNNVPMSEDCECSQDIN